MSLVCLINFVEGFAVHKLQKRQKTTTSAKATVVKERLKTKGSRHYEKQA